MADANFGTYDQVCGNGIDEDLFNRVIDVLEKNDCDNRGEDIMLFQDGDYTTIEEDKNNKIRYDMTEGFCVSGSSNGFFYWLMVILFIFLLYWVIFAPNQTPVQVITGAVSEFTNKIY